MISKPYNTLLAVAQELKLFLTPARQTYAQLPTGIYPLWSEDFFAWCLGKFGFGAYVDYLVKLAELCYVHHIASAQIRTQLSPDE